MVEARVGVILVGHGQTASHILRAARGIVATETLEGLLAVDAGAGESEVFADAICAAIDTDSGSSSLANAAL